MTDLKIKGIKTGFELSSNRTIETNKTKPNDREPFEVFSIGNQFFKSYIAFWDNLLRAHRLMLLLLVVLRYTHSSIFVPTAYLNVNFIV